MGLILVCADQKTECFVLCWGKERERGTEGDRERDRGMVRADRERQKVRESGGEIEGEKRGAYRHREREKEGKVKGEKVRVEIKGLS